ncbi:MAG: Holliday junction branch migration protein RuvA [Candidatus Cloacimonetes bacterium]|jgi:Holliday junction DNA helicase RuvA|nr:Holliday junction branch migration protein RuvA [Candidatus Cloacimonadota bacterium]MDD4156236.1 Holliday junction branch migration protein RuvA [Candidatus Cloacimonadota bacterium]
MYNYLYGILSEKTADRVVIDCGGIGFEVKIPLSTFDLLPDKNEKIKLLIHTYHNDEGTRLFGFFTQAEKDTFKLLINVSRIGPKIALSILSNLSVNDLVSAVMSNNDSLISKAPGLGKKSAQRLIIELKDKISEITPSKDISHNNTIISSDKWQEVDTALLALGFKSFEIRKATQELIFKDTDKTQDIVKACIKYIYMKRNE